MTQKSKSKDDDDEDGVGCILFIGVACLAIGAGTIWGDGAGWLAAGIALVLIVAIGLRRA